MYSCGQSWEYWDNTLTAVRMLAFRRYWVKHPPTHIVAAAFIEKNESEPPNPKDLLGHGFTGS